MRRHILILLTLVFALGLGVGCTSPSTTGAETTAGPAPASSSADGSVPAPGRTPKRGGRVEIVGTLQRDDSGAWLVVDQLPAAAASGRVIAKIVNSGSLAGVDLAALENSYVRVVGTAAAGAATDKSGLGVVADTVKALPVP